MRKLSDPIPELGNRTWADLEVVEHADGHLLFSDVIRKRATTGEPQLVPCRVRIVRPVEIAAARVECRRWCQELGLDAEKDRDVFDELEQICILARAIRTFEAPHGQMHDHRELAAKYDEASLQDILGRIEALKTIVDVREQQLTTDDIWEVISQVAKAGHLLPLTGIAGREQPSCIAFMALQAMKSPMGVAWSQSRAKLTREPSGSTNSAKSSEEPEG